MGSSRISIDKRANDRKGNIRIVRMDLEQIYGTLVLPSAAVPVIECLQFPTPSIPFGPGRATE